MEDVCISDLYDLLYKFSIIIPSLNNKIIINQFITPFAEFPTSIPPISGFPSLLIPWILSPLHVYVV